MLVCVGRDVIVAVETAVTSPLALTVIIGTKVADPNEPTFELTVANVAFVIAVPVVPDSVKSPPVTEIDPLGIVTAVVDIAVTKPFALTVITGIAEEDPNAPTFELTVASVVATLPAVEVISPV